MHSISVNDRFTSFVLEMNQVRNTSFLDKYIPLNHNETHITRPSVFRRVCMQEMLVELLRGIRTELATRCGLEDIADYDYGTLSSQLKGLRALDSH